MKYASIAAVFFAWLILTTVFVGYCLTCPSFTVGIISAIGCVGLFTSLATLAIIEIRKSYEIN